MTVIKHKTTGETLIEIDGDLRCADLSNMCLRGADLHRANLWGTNLQRANLQRANLQRANLQRANLWGTVGNGSELISLFLFGEYPIDYTSEVLQIGCKQHTFEEWKEFSDRQILEMDGKTALKFWKENKEFIFEIIERRPAKPTNQE